MAKTPTPIPIPIPIHFLLELPLSPVAAGEGGGGGEGGGRRGGHAAAYARRRVRLRRGARGAERRRQPMSATLRSAFVWLQRAQAATTLSQECGPPPACPERHAEDLENPPRPENPALSGSVLDAAM